MSDGGREGECAGRGTGTSRSGRGRRRPDARGPPLLGKGAWGTVASSRGVTQSCLGAGGGAGVACWRQDPRAAMICCIPQRLPQVPVRWPPSPRLFILLPAAGLLAPGRGVLRPGPRERAACVSGPGQRGRCPMAWRLMPGRVPIHLISRGRFSAHLQLLWAEFPRFQPAPCPARPDALPPCQPPRSCPLCPWETWGVLGRLAGRAGGPWGLSVGRASWAQHSLWAHTTRGLSQLAVGARPPWKNTGSFLLRKGLAGGGWKEATLHAGGQGRGRQLWGAPRRLPCSRPWRLTEQASLRFGNQVLY